MTSKHCFANYMREDFRHKIWMLALSVLGNVMAIPVVYMLIINNRYTGMESYRLSMRAHSLSTFLKSQSILPAGVIALTGALIVGIGGFRYLFHKDMVDTYESIPVKKSTRFLATWLNGFLIWFVPYLINMALLTGFVIKEYLGCKAEWIVLTEINKTEVIWLSAGQLLLLALGNILAMTVCFLVIYNMIILCQMLCGNAINLLLISGVVGGGVAALYGLFAIFCSYYLETWVGNIVSGFEKIVYGSPAVSAVYCLIMYADQVLHGAPAEANKIVAANLALAIVLFVLAYIAFIKRPSELAEQGTNHVPVRLVIQIPITLIAMMGGWLVFAVFAGEMTGSNSAVAWGVFGSILCGAFVFGVTNIIFYMDFKAFFKRKLLMIPVLAAGLLICFDFAFDWSGFDTYIPKEDQILSAAAYVPGYCLDRYGRDATEVLDEINLSDVSIVRDIMTIGVQKLDQECYEGYLCQPYVRVTLKSGKVVYRRYDLDLEGRAVIERLITSKEYIDACYDFEDGYAETVTSININRYFEGENLGKKAVKAAAEKLIDAYRADLRENPKGVIAGAKTYCLVYLQSMTFGKNYEIAVTESMPNSIRVLTELGYGRYVTDLPAEAAANVTVTLSEWGLSVAKGVTAADKLENIFGVRPDGSGASGTVTVVKGNDYWEFQITDKDEIREFLKGCSYSNSNAYILSTACYDSDCRYEDVSGEMALLDMEKGRIPVSLINRIYETVKDWDGVTEFGEPLFEEEYY